MPDSREQYAEKLLGAVNDAAAAVSSRFVTFVSVGAYVAVTVAATTHEMLLRASSVVTILHRRPERLGAIARSEFSGP